MRTQKHESLFARLSSEVYDRLNLRNCSYSEFFFKEMSTIFELEGMERWPMVTDAKERNRPQLLFSLVCFSPLKECPDEGQESMKISKAHSLALDMFVNCFESDDDHRSIELAMDICPTVAIFMCPVSGKKNKKQDKKKKSKNQQ